MMLGDEHTPSPAFAGEVPLVFQRGDGGAGSCPPLSVRSFKGVEQARTSYMQHTFEDRSCFALPQERRPHRAPRSAHFPHEWGKERKFIPNHTYKLENTL
jgi:hypothetical protein